jgi:anaerobic magnesium-protoporphyrin IX monomethyl ester cyclase
MRILLINPTAGPESEYGALSKIATELPQLGLAAVATALRGAGHAADILDAHIEGLSPERIIQRIRAEKIDVVGFSVYITTEKRTLRFAEALEAACPDVTVIVGGPQATLAPQRFAIPAIDYIFLGEADESILELMDALNQGEPLRPIAGVIATADPKGFPSQRDLRLVKDIDSLGLIELDKFYPLDRFYPAVDVRGKRLVNLVSTRGCPYKCTFCAAAEINGRSVRGMSPERFGEHVQYYVDKGIDSFVFYDDTFTINKKRAIAICKELVRRKLKIQWKCFTRVDCLSVEVLDNLREAGCYHVMFGCESFNDKTLTLLKKGFTVEQCFSGIKMAHDAGMLTSSSFMIGLPGETEDDIRHTIRTVATTDLDFALFPIFEPYEGTPVHDVCREMGRWVTDESYSNRLLQDQGEVWVPHSCSRPAIERLSKEAFHAFFLRPRSFWNVGKHVLTLPFQRKVRLISGAFEYFIGQRFKARTRQVGVRYH